jgi:hypothetical protein
MNVKMSQPCKSLEDCSSQFPRTAPAREDKVNVRSRFETGIDKGDEL